MMSVQKEDVLKANIELHSQLASVYNTNEPHQRPENIQVVRSRLERLKEKVKGQKLLDIGCGTGFMIHIAKELGFKSIMGVDITPKMLEQVNRDGDTPIELHLGDVSNVPAEAESFEIVTAYSFIDHLYDVEAVFKEVNRCLKDGGVFYAGLIPNQSFWSAINGLDKKQSYGDFISREIRHVTFKDEEMQETYGVTPDTFNIAEYQKNIKGGLSEVNLTKTLSSAGFKHIEFTYDWFLGQGQINNEPNLDQNNRSKQIHTIDQYLRDNLPLTQSLFKYLSFYAYR